MEKKMENRPKTYSTGYIAAITFIVLSIIILLISGALNPNSDSYYPKMFVLGVLLYFWGVGLLIDPGTTRGVEAETRKELRQSLFRNSPVKSKVVWGIFTAIAFLFVVYSVFIDEMLFVTSLSKIAVLFSCVCVAIKAIVTLVISIRHVPSDGLDTHEEDAEEKDDIEPPVLLIGMLIAALAVMVIVFCTLSENEKMDLYYMTGGHLLLK